MRYDGIAGEHATGAASRRMARDRHAKVARAERIEERRARRASRLSPVLRESVDLARELAWWPIANQSSPLRYRARLELHGRLVASIDRTLAPYDAPLSLVYLIEAMRRVARASFVNRMGDPYYERRAAMLQLRGCLDVYDRRDS